MILHKLPANDYTVLPNRFIDEYMCPANGEFVKIYLYLLRHSASGIDCTLSSIADIFNCTENDVRRALTYWEKQNLLKLSYDSEGILTDITFTEEIPAEEPSARRLTGYARHLNDASSTSASDGRCESSPAPETSSSEPVSADVSAEPLPAQSHPSVGSSSEDPVVYPMSGSDFSVTAERKKELSVQEDVRDLLMVAEQYLGRTLSGSDINHLLYFYDELHLPQELIIYLLEYCVSKGKKGLPYIRKVAVSWAEKGIRTIEEAQKESSLYQREYYSILKELGIHDRQPAPAEAEFMYRWMNEWKFSMDMILEACSRTILRTHGPNFKYADGILSSWYKQGISRICDIPKELSPCAEKQDGSLQNTSDKTASCNKKPSSSNPFFNFEQRTYDFDKLEQQLLDC